MAFSFGRREKMIKLPEAIHALKSCLSTGSVEVIVHQKALDQAKKYPRPNVPYNLISENHDDLGVLLQIPPIVTR